MNTVAHVCQHAAQMIAGEANALRAAHAPHDDWTGEADAHADYQDMTRTAGNLLQLAAEFSRANCLRILPHVGKHEAQNAFERLIAGLSLAQAETLGPDIETVRDYLWKP